MTLIIVLDFNYPKPIKYKGSAILYIASEKRKTKFTEGCLAIKKKDCLELIILHYHQTNCIIKFFRQKLQSRLLNKLHQIE